LTDRSHRPHRHRHGDDPIPGSDEPGSPAAQLNCPTPSLCAEAERLEQLFDTGLRARDVGAAVTAVLEPEQTIVDWSADTEEIDGTGGPRAMLRRMVTRLAQLAVTGARDPQEVVRPFVEALLELR
jgi:hypothetical protein